jgi:hypothetical protein
MKLEKQKELKIKMKKKIITAITATALVLGLGTAAIASTDVVENFNFQDMLPFMQKMHPDMDKEQLEEMFNRCHGEGGMMNGERGNKMMEGMMNGNYEGMKNMMNRF